MAMKGFILVADHNMGQSIWTGNMWTHINNGDVPRVYASEFYASQGMKHVKPINAMDLHGYTSAAPIRIAPVTITFDKTLPLWKVRLSAWWSAVRSVFARLSA